MRLQKAKNQKRGPGKAADRKAALSAQQTIPYLVMHPDGVCQLPGGLYTKTVEYEDINYSVASTEDQTAIFGGWSSFLNYFDTSLPFQLSFINRRSRSRSKYRVNIPQAEDIVVGWLPFMERELIMDNRIDAIYGRQSIDKKDSISIESQFEFCRYELKGGEGREYKDKGYSGKNIERPDFQRLLQDIKLGLIKRVIVYKLDRISRSIVDFAKLMELFKQYNVEFVSCTEKFDTSTPMGRAMLNICIVFAQLERESIQMRVQDAFYSRCTKGYYMRGRTPYGFDTEPIVMDGIKTKKLVENAEMDFAELMYQMYAEPSSSYGDITRYFVKNSIDVYGKALQRAFISKLLRNPVYVQADMDIYEYFKAQGVKIESPPEMFTGDNSCYLYQGREGEEQILVIAPHQGRIPSSLWLTVQRKLSQNTSFQNGRKCHNTWLAGKIKCGRCGYALVGLRAQNGVTYLRCKQRADNGSCEGAGTLTAQSMESFVYGEMVEKMRKYHTLKGGKEPGYNPKLTAARVALAKTESEIEKLLDTLSGANPLLLQYANNRIEELDAERQKQLKLVADLTANSVSDTQIDCITNYLNDWESVSFDDKRKVVDILISHIDATSESVTIHWKI